MNDTPVTAPDASAATHVVRLAPRIDREADKAKGLGGHYRVIHGSMLLPRPEHEWHHADGSEILGEPKTIKVGIHPSSYDANGNPTGYVGDELWLSDGDAKRALDAGVVEPIDSEPSRCGQVWDPPKPGEFA